MKRTKIAKRNFRGEKRKSSSKEYATSVGQSILPRDVIEYLSNVAEHFNNETDPSVKAAMAENLREECANYDSCTMLNSSACVSIDAICNHHHELSIFFLQQTLKCKKADVERLLSSNESGRCMESILYNAANLATEKPLAAQQILDIAEIAINAYNYLSTNFAGCHLLRCLGRILCGLGKNQNENKVIPMPPEFRSPMINLISTVLQWNSMSDKLWKETNSLLVQEFLEIDAKCAKTKAFSQWIIECCKCSDEHTIFNQIKDKQGSRVWEKIITLCDEDELEKVAKKFFYGHLLELSKDSFANFVIQRLFERCKSEEMLTDLYDELLPFLNEIWTTRKFGVVTSMTRAAAEVRFQQKEFLKRLRGCIACSTKATRPYLVPVILQLTTITDVAVDEAKRPILVAQNIQLHGSLIVQHLLNFKKPKLTVASLMNLTEPELCLLACHNIGSHVLDAFFASSISPEQKQQMLNKLKNNIVKLVCDRVGSRVFESIWKNVDADERFQLAFLLNAKESAIRTNQFGRIIYLKYELETFKRNKKQWKNRNENSRKRRKIND